MNPRDYEITFAGAGEREIFARARYVRVLDATGDVFIKADDASEVKRVKGQALNLETGFSKITIRSAIAQTVRVVLASLPQDDASTSVNATVSATVAPANTLDAGGDVNILATSSALLSAGDVTRMALIVSNPASNTAAVRVGGAGVGAASGVAIEPGESITLATTAAVYGYNTSSGAQSVQVLPMREV